MRIITKQEGKSLDIVNENIKALERIFPEAFTEDGIDFDVLRELLGDEIIEQEEKYGLNWYGKKKARQIALTPSMGTLRPCPEESVDWDTTQNLFIEGDNLEVLKLLQKSYANKVKLIYIDPPYNTGKEFIYPDKFQDNLDTYLRYTGQKDDEGFKNSSNTESSGRYHTNWLNMMLPRLKLARSLLRNDGVIFISIDDNEIANLRKLCDEIFGEENFVVSIAWQSRTSVQNDTDISEQHEYLVGYAKERRIEHRRLKENNKDVWYKLSGFAAYPLPLEKSRFSNPDNDARGLWKADPFDAPNIRPNLTYEIINPNTGEEYWPPAGRCWRTDEKTYKKLLSEKRILFGKTGKSRPQLKVFYNEKKEFGEVNRTWWDGNTYGTSTSGTKELQELFEHSPFTYPKPTLLMENLMKLAIKDDGIILDFFAGSCTTAHSVIQQNATDNGNRRFIMVQLPEPCDNSSEVKKVGYKTIAEIGKERIRRAITKIKKENPEYDGDLGFKVFKLASSNIRAWNPDRSNLEQTLLDHTEHLVESRSEEDVLYELLLKRGVELTVPIEEKKIASKTVYSIGYGVLYACLNTALNQDQIEELALGIIDWYKQLAPAGDTHVVFRDSAFENDIAKTNMTAILEQHGIAHVQSL